MHEYKTRYKLNDREYESTVTTDPKKVGEQYRGIIKAYPEMQEVEILKRTVSEWETVKKKSQPD